jgi:hypothetical protein
MQLGIDRRVSGLLAVVAAVHGVACGGAVERVAEKAATPAVEDAGSPDPGAAEGGASTPGGSFDPLTGCAGDGIVPDVDGFVAADTNASGISGSWQLYTDCDDYSGMDAGEPSPGVNCSRVTAPAPGTPFGPQPGTAQMCTAGSTVEVDLDSQWLTRWGAYVALGLNAPDGVQRPFDANAAGITGFCFYVTGATIPVFRVRFPTDQGFADRDWYQVTLEHEGWHEVLFADLEQVTTTGIPFDARKVESIEFEIPSSMAERVSWDFCIDGLTAIR